MITEIANTIGSGIALAVPESFFFIELGWKKEDNKPSLGFVINIKTCGFRLGTVGASASASAQSGLRLPPRHSRGCGFRLGTVGPFGFRLGTVGAAASASAQSGLRVWDDWA